MKFSLKVPSRFMMKGMKGIFRSGLVPSLFFGAFFFSGGAFAAFDHQLNIQSKSVLTHRVALPSLGEVAYRPPLTHSAGDTVVLFQGVFGGTTHRHFSELRELLDRAGYRVFTMDLIGTGESNSPKIVADTNLLNTFVEEFMTTVVKSPAIVIAEQLLGTAAMNVSKQHAGLFRHLFLISPIGMIYLANPPNQAQNDLFNRFWNDDAGALKWYQSLVGEASARFYLGKAYHDPAQVTEERIREITMCADFPGQTWASLSFVAGRIHQSFTSAAAGVKVPVTAIFGQFPQAPVTNGKPETFDLFQAAVPQFDYVVIPNAANLPHREQAQAVFDAIEEAL